MTKTSNCPRNGGPRWNLPARQGMALALVLLVVAAAVVMGLCFLSVGATSAPVSRMVDERLQARMIAESAIDMTLAHLRRGTGWRAGRTEGQWVTRQAFGGGAFSIWGYDGEDTNGDGVLEGNGVFADDVYAPVTLTALAEYGGVRHSVKAVFRPAGPPAVAVADHAAFLNNALLDSYDARVAPYSAATAGKAATLSSNSTGKPNITLAHNAVIAGNLYFPRQADSSLALNITGSAKVTGTIGKLQVDEISVAPIVPPECTPSTTDVTYSNTAVTMAGDVICRDFKLLGSSVLRVPANYRIICDRDFVVDNTAQIILANPRYGHDVPFGSTQNAANNQQVATLITVPEELEVVSIAAYLQKSGKDVRYALYTDKNGAPGTLVVQSARQPVQQDTFYWHEMTVPPTKIAAGTYWLALSVETGAPIFAVGAGGKTAVRAYDGLANGFLTNWGTSDLNFPNSVNIYLTGNVPGKGGTLDVYTSGKLSIGGACKVNMTTQMPSRVNFWHGDPDDTGEAAVKLVAAAYATIHAPDATVRVTEWAQFHGVIRAADVIVEKSAVVRVDSSGGVADPGMLIGRSLRMSDTARIEGLAGTTAVVASCSVGSPVIWLRNRSALRGDAYGGPGGAGGNSDIQVGSDAVLTGKRKNLLAAVDMTRPPPPTGLPVIPDRTVSSGTTVFSSNFQSGNITIDGTGVVEIRGNVTAVVRELHLHQNAKLRLAPDARLTLFITGRLHVVDDCELNLGGDPSRVTLNISGFWVDVRGRAKVCAAVVAPGTLFRVTDDAQVFGTVRSRWLLLDRNGQIHADVRPERVRWIEQ